MILGNLVDLLTNRNEIIIGFQATLDEINKSYRQKCLIFHPDRHLDPDEKKIAENFFLKLRKAHESKFFFYLNLWCYRSKVFELKELTLLSNLSNNHLNYYFYSTF